MAILEIRPQKMQERFLASPADIAIGGGSAGSGKTFSLLMEPLRHIHNPKFSAIFFRRESKQIHLPGGLFDTAMEIYPGIGAKHRLQPMLEFTFQSGAKVVMTHLNLESDVSAYQGSQIPLIIYDELCHFSKTQFFYLLSRNRSTCGVKPYIRASCNPDPDSWVASFIEWWIDWDTGFPIPERGGQLRYFITVPTETDTVQVWGDDPHEAVSKATGLSRPSDEALRLAGQKIDAHLTVGEDAPDDDEAIFYVKAMRSAKSVTFIPSRIYDNPALLKKDPSYLSNLKALSRVERGRLLEGNWKIRPAAGTFFPKPDARIIPELPDDITRWVRSWDLAAIEPNESNRDPDWTVGMKLGRRKNGRVVIADVRRVRRNAASVRELVMRTAFEDGISCWIQLPQDPGQAGRDQSDSYREMLRGFSLFSRIITRNKMSMAEPAAASWQRGSIEMVLAPWNDGVLDELDKFPDPKIHDDCVDALSGGFNLLPSGDVPNYHLSGFSRKYRELA